MDSCNLHITIGLDRSSATIFTVYCDGVKQQFCQAASSVAQITENPLIAIVVWSKTW